MPRSTLTSKGQITLPKEVREKLELDTGSQVDFILQTDGNVLLKPAKFDIQKLKGILKSRKQRPVTIEEMNAAMRSRVKKSR